MHIADRIEKLHFNEGFLNINRSKSLENPSDIVWNYSILYKEALREKCPNTELFLVRIFPHSD